MKARVGLLVIIAIILSLTQIGSSQSLTLAWDPSPSAAAVAYRVYARPAGSDPQLVGQLPISATSQTVNVQYDTDYEFWLTALDITGLEGPPSNSAFGRVNAPLPSPSADGTKVFAPAGSLVDCSGVRWSFGPQRTAIDYTALRSSVDTGGYGSVYKLSACVVWILGSDATWYQWNAGWVYTGQTWEPGTTPPPSPPTDVNAPIASLTVARSGKSANFTATASATDNVGVVSFSLTLDGRVICSTNPCTYTAKVSKGSHTFIATAKDAAGNTGMAARTVTYWSKVQGADFSSRRRV